MQGSPPKMAETFRLRIYNRVIAQMYNDVYLQMNIAKLLTDLKSPPCWQLVGKRTLLLLTNTHRTWSLKLGTFLFLVEVEARVSKWSFCGQLLGGYIYNICIFWCIYIYIDVDVCGMDCVYHVCVWCWFCVPCPSGGGVGGHAGSW